MEPVRLNFIGNPAFFLEDIPVIITRRKAIVLLAYLAWKNKPVSRSLLADLFWPDVDESHGRGNLRLALNAVRSRLGPELVLSRDDSLELNAGAVAECDIWSCREVFRSFRDCDSPEQAVDRLEPFIGAPFLHGLNLDSSPGLDDWRYDVHREIESAIMNTLEQLRKTAAEEGDQDLAYRCAELLLLGDNTRGDLQEYLVEADLRRGDIQKARDRYERYARILARETGEIPSERITRLVKRTKRLRFSIPPGRGRNRRKAAWLLALVPLVFVLVFLSIRLSGSGKQEVSLGVLPFRFLCGEEGLEAASDNFTSELITSLAMRSVCPVSPHASVRRYRDTPLTVQEIAGDLGVSYILDGSAMRRGHLIRYSVQLIEIRTDSCLWAGFYEYEFEDSLESQARAVSDITDNVMSEISGIR